MSNENVIAAPPPESAVESTSPSWLGIFAGLSFVATVSVLAAILSVRYFQSRPVNIETPSAQLAEVIERALIEHNVPASAIETSVSKERSDEGNRWTHNEFQVTLPPRLDSDGVAQLVGDELREYNLTVTREDSGSGGQHVKVWLANFEVASIALSPAVIPDDALADLRTASNRLVSEARAGIEALGGAEATLFQGLPEMREDAQARWYLTKLELRAPRPVDQAEIKHAIQSAITFPDVDVRASEPLKNEMNVTVAYRGKPVAELTVVMPEGEARPAPAIAPGVQPSLFELLDSVLPSPTPPIPYAPEEPLEVETTPGTDTAISKGNATPVDMSLAPPAPEGERMQLARLPEPPGPRSAQDALNPRVAIILDDGGYGGKVTERVLALDPRLTLAILPNTPYGRSTAEQAKALGFELMLHMPMQTDSDTVKPFPGQINVGMEPVEIAALTTDAVAQVPGAVGVNNHTGSKFTADEEHMEYFLDALDASQLYFVDSRTAPNSRGYEVARRRGFRSASRDVFLDDVPNVAEIRRQWAEMIRIARKTGSAIAIGHFRPLTLDVLEQEIPKLAAAGITLVHASELVQ